MAIKPIFEKRNVLVTGGAGFIGSHLCDRLVKEAHVICVDNFINSSERNIDHLLKNPDFEFIRADITAPIDLDGFKELEKFKVKFQGIQEIYHLACPTSAKNFDQFKMDTLFANALGMKNVLDLAVRYEAKLVHASSAVVYGPRRADNPSFKEEDIGAVNHLTGRGCYDEGKRFAETMVETYRQVHGIDAKVARIFRTYGPRQRLFDGEMIPDFITNALEGKELVMYGDEKFTTSLVYVTDLVDGLIRLMAAPAGVGVVNLGGEEDVPLVDVARKIIELTGSASRISFEPPLMFITPLGLPETAKAREKIGWLPLVKLDQGLKLSVDYANAHKSLLGV